MTRIDRDEQDEKDKKKTILFGTILFIPVYFLPRTLIEAGQSEPGTAGRVYFSSKCVGPEKLGFYERGIK
jgi:hypothetical protein